MKYKVGDKIRVRKKLIPKTKYGDVYFAINMREYEGEEAIVKEVGAIAYHLDIDGGMYWWTDEMFEPVEEMSAEEAIRIQAEMCNSMSGCVNCPLNEEKDGYCCESFKVEHPEQVVEILKQWKKDHEKKETKTEIVDLIKVMKEVCDDETCIYAYEIDINKEKIDDKMMELVKEYSDEQNGKIYAKYERICRVKS
jgi:hypothetical protein